MQFSSSVYSQTYNELPDVLVADKKLNAMSKNDILDSLCRTILKHNLENVIGIRLLHNHNSIDPDEMMLEQEEMNAEGEYRLSTMAVKKAACEGSLHPNSWSLSKMEMVPLEFSLDPVVVSESGAVINNRGFFSEFYENLEALDVADILGPCMIGRDFYNKRMPEQSNEVMLVETTDAERRANVLRFCRNDVYKPEQLIQTTWMATRPEEGAETMLACTVGSCSPVCIVIVHCDRLENGGHSSTSRHEQRNHWKEHIKAPF